MVKWFVQNPKNSNFIVFVRIVRKSDFQQCSGSAHSYKKKKEKKLKLIRFTELIQTSKQTNKSIEFRMLLYTITTIILQNHLKSKEMFSIQWHYFICH